MPSMTPDMPNSDPEQPQGRDRLKTYPTYWRSLEQLADTPEFRAELERQPALGADEALHASRRRFLQTMGASLGLAGLATTGCIRLPEEKLAPYAHRPENRTPGTPVSYATAMEIGGVAQGLLVTSFDGRPIKIEGNPSHPLNGGAADFLAQASVLELYDPDRSRGVSKKISFRGRGGDGPDDEPETSWQPASWDEFRSEFIKLIPADGARLLCPERGQQFAQPGGDAPPCGSDSPKPTGTTSRWATTTSARERPPLSATTGLATVRRCSNWPRPKSS